MQINDRQQQVEELFHSALPLKAEDRAEFLARACVGDERLRREVESFLEALERRPAFIEESPASLIMQMLAGNDGGALVGRSIGQFKILRLLGGGMSYVYLAEDRKLGREVALKFIAHTLVDDQRAKEQLTNEARAVVKLGNHSNICTVHGIEEIDGFTFIVMEYVEGQTLDTLIGGKRLAPGRALDVAEQTVNALAAAHAQKIIHRDVKPQNIIVTAGGLVKVLDFGIAKLSRASQPAEEFGSPEQGRTAQQGLIVGTIAYMSPEQARGEKLDARSDIFSFGIVLYELLGGRHPFRLRHTAESAQDILEAIKTAAPPPLMGLAPGLPSALHRIARKCLEKGREQRYQTADALLRDLRKLRRSHMLWRYARPALALTLLLIAAAVFVYLRYTQTHTLAVAPVVNASGDQDMDALGAALTKSLAGKLSHLARLRLRAPTIPDKDQAPDPASIGRALQAEAVLTGKIVRQDGAPQLQISLLDSADGSTLWQVTAPVNLSEIQTLQDRLALKTVAGLNMWLSRDEERLLLRHQTDNTEALRLYITGQYLWDTRDKEKLKAAIEKFKQATALDPSYAQAWAGLADSYSLQTTVAYGPEPPNEVIEKAQSAAYKALQSDSMLSEAHTALGVIQLRYGWNWAEAEREFRLAIELRRDYSPAHYWYSFLLRALDRNDEALKESEIYKRLEPFTPMATVNVAISYYRARQYVKAAAVLRQVLAEIPNEEHALYLLGLVYVKQEKYPEAIETLERLYSTKPLYAAAPLGYAYARTGRQAQAFRLLATLDQEPPDKPVPAQEKAIIYMGLRDNDKAFMYLEKAYEERFASLVTLTTEPFFDDLRADPRFYDLARRMNLPIP